MSARRRRARRRFPRAPVTVAELARAPAADVLAFTFPDQEPGGDVIAGILADIERTAALLTIALDLGPLPGDDFGRTLLAIQHRAAAARTLYERALRAAPHGGRGSPPFP